MTAGIASSSFANFFALIPGDFPFSFGLHVPLTNENNQIILRPLWPLSG